jgi:hypothetical protein
METIMKNLTTRLRLVSLLSLILLAATGGYAQVTPSADSYTNTADPATNYGTKTVLDVEAASQTTYIRFDLSSIPADYSSANITKATLKLYVNSVTAAGSFNVDYVTGTWAENTITADLAPALGTTIAASVPLTVADKNQYILIDVTPAVQAWLSGTANDGLALVGNSPVNATFDSKESTSTSHAAELDIVFAGGSGGGIAGITTASGSGLIGGGTSGTLNLSLTHTCAAKQILQWSGSAWVCASPAGSGTVTSVASGAGLTGGPVTGSGTLSIAPAGVSNAMLTNPSLTISPGTALTGGGSVALGGGTTLSLDTTKVPLLAAANTFSANQTVNGTIVATSTTNTIVANTNGTAATAVEGTGAFYGVWGAAAVVGVTGVTASTSGIGVQGNSFATTGTTYGVNGTASSNLGIGVLGSSPHFGVEGVSSNVGVYGVGGAPSTLGTARGAGVWGDTGGQSGANVGVLGTSDNSLAGEFYSRNIVYPTIYAENEATTAGGLVFDSYVAAVGAAAVIGDPGCNEGFIGLQLGEGFMQSCENYTLAGGTNGHTYINAASGGAVHVRIDSVEQLVATSGNVDVIGTLSKGGGSFKIDHPLDPANKYLYHSFVESPDMMNIYNGNATTDASGEVVVKLPEWFETLNRDFRYQLTVIGQFAQAIVAEKVANHQFVIRTDKPNVEVSWQVTGIRQDAFANAHRIQVEVEKAPADRGHYLYPELVGAPKTARIGYMAPAPESEQVVHSRPAVQKRGMASPSEQPTPPRVPIPPATAVLPAAVSAPHPVVPGGKVAVKQK